MGVPTPGASGPSLLTDHRAHPRDGTQQHGEGTGVEEKPLGAGLCLAGASAASTPELGVAVGSLTHAHGLGT